MRQFRYHMVWVLLALPVLVTAQERVMTFGFQIKPIVPSDFFRSGTNTIIQNNVEFSVSQKLGYAGGMTIRKGLSKRFSIETGINYVKRDFHLEIYDSEISFTNRKDFTIVGYETPIQGLIFIRLGEMFYMNAAFGLALDFFPSDVSTSDRTYFHRSNRNSWIQTALLSNLGYEYRSKKSGIFYLGASFHRPFKDMYRTKIEYYEDILLIKEETITSLSGNYLTVDFRYFFHEDPEKIKSKTKKSKKKRK